MMVKNQVRQLERLARLYGVETAYRDLNGRLTPASPEGLTAILRALGAPISRWEDIPGALRERRQALWRETIEPVVVAWDGAPVDVELRLPSDLLSRRAAWHLELETGGRRSSKLNLERLPTERGDAPGRRKAGPVAHRDTTPEVEGVRYLAKRLRLPGKLPHGYHRLTLEIGGATAQSLVISAPTRAYGDSPDGGSEDRPWGVFLPLHALHSKRSWGCGDFSELEALLDWTHGLGGSAVATLPLLATFLDQPFDPSPYAPASRLFWNELFLDLERVPEFRSSPASQACFHSPEMQTELAAMRSGRLVDYRRTMAAKRRMLECVAGFLNEGSGSSAARREAFEQFRGTHPQAEDYARFRAVLDRERRPWTEWPEALAQGRIEDGDFDPAAARTHLYAQWLCHEQLGALAAKARRCPPGLCLDLPLGIHPAGYDVWRHRELYAGEVTAGAPPDILFTGGQNWGFPPVHPQAQRQQGYRYYADCLRHQFRHAGLVRVDHVMGLHRLFWIPQGLDPTYGAYVRYPADELYAVLCLESNRGRSMVAGENLGNVPRYVNPAMVRHNIRQLYIVQYVLAGRDRLRPVEAGSVGSLNTHDMPTFSAFWQGADIEDRRALGFLKERPAAAERKLRAAVRKSNAAYFKRRGWLASSSMEAAASAEVVRCFLKFLASSSSDLVLVNLEDLWLESDPQNVPGTLDQRPNWRRKARHAFESFCQMPEVLDTLREVNRLRRSG